MIQGDYPKRMRHLGASRYKARIRAATVRAAECIPSEKLDDVFMYIDHNEGLMGLEELAWIIVEEQVKVPAIVIATIRRYEHLGDSLPPTLDDYVLPE